MSRETPPLVAIGARIVLAFIVLLLILMAIGFLGRLLLKYAATHMSP